MKEKTIVSVFTLIVILFLSTYAHAITQSQINQVLAKIDEAAQSRDVDTIASILSDSVQIIVDVPTPNGSVKVDLNKEQYLDMLAQSWAVIGPDYTYARKSVDIAISESGTEAQAASVVFEEMTLTGQLISSESLEVTNFVEENGEIKVTKVVAQSYVQGSPVPKPSI